MMVPRSTDLVVVTTLGDCCLHPSLSTLSSPVEHPGDFDDHLVIGLVVECLLAPIDDVLSGAPVTLGRSRLLPSFVGPLLIRSVPVFDW